ncbi:MAG: hypothetical protein ACREQ3_24580 [Candidatus Binatia bacterium]
MPGTVHISTSAVHTFQRRFGTAELRRAVGAANLYLVSRRPRTRLELRTTRNPWQRRERVMVQVGNAWYEMGNVGIDQLGVSPDGRYFKGLVAERPVHGEAWALATVISGALDFSKHEILYVGKSEDVEARLAKHATLQRIYEDHSTSDWDIFVTPLLIEQTYLTNDDHIDDDGSRVHDEAIFNLMDALGGRARGRASRTAISLAEHAMITYFCPEYNRQLRSWNAQKKTPEMELLWRAGHHLAVVMVQGAFELAAFFGAGRVPRRVHVIAAEVPANPRLKGFGAISLSEVEVPDVAEGLRMLVESSKEAQDMYEASPALLTIFGEAPADSVPSDLNDWLAKG